MGTPPALARVRAAEKIGRMIQPESQAIPATAASPLPNLAPTIVGHIVIAPPDWQPVPPDLITIAEASRRYGISRYTIYRWIETGLIRAWGRRTHIHVSAAELMPPYQPTRPGAMLRTYRRGQRRAKHEAKAAAQTVDAGHRSHGGAPPGPAGEIPTAPPVSPDSDGLPVPGQS
mgnify:CR=1 FL=1